MRRDNKRLNENLVLWAEITDFCLELRRSFLKKKYPAVSEDKLDVDNEHLINRKINLWKKPTFLTKL